MLYCAICVAIIILDVVTKQLAIKHLELISGLPLWEGVFHLTYVENRGAAFGIFEGGKWFLIIVTIIILIIMFFAARLFKGRSRLLSLSLTFIAAGAIGNLIDRIFRNFVVDFFDFCLIGFPVFNVADVFVCVGAALLIIYIIFFEDSKSYKKGCEDNEG